MSFIAKLLSRDLASLTRWHHKQTYLKESVAEHSAFVARISYELSCLLMETLGHDFIVRPMLIGISGLYHDDSELNTGDIPFSLKQDIPGARKIVEGWEYAVADKLWVDYPEFLNMWLIRLTRQSDLTLTEKEILHYADNLAALAYAQEQVHLGNEFMVPTLIRIKEYLQTLQYNWLVLLREAYEVP